jgi:protein phosphatase
VISILKKEPVLIRFKPPAKIFGSIHGQFKDLLRFFENYGVPDSNPGFGQSDIEAVGYVFLGNYVDRGKNSLEVICTLLALKLKYPREIILLRGAHEDRFINMNEGLATECEQRIGENVRHSKSIFNKLNEVFEYLSLACLIGKKVLCVPSGIGEHIKNISDLKNISKPIKVNHGESSSINNKMVLDLLWSDPVQDLNENENQLNEQRSYIAKGSIIKFGIDRIKSFMNNNAIDVLIRSHEPVKEGVEKFGETNLYTVFSCSDYGGTHKNYAALLHFKKHQNQLKSLSIEPIEGMTKWFSFNNLKKSFLNRSIFTNDDSTNDLMGPRETVTPLRKYKKTITQ